jgi:3-deoxy-D-manno-octulosonic-acid transferase
MPTLLQWEALPLRRNPVKLRYHVRLASKSHSGRLRPLQRTQQRARVRYLYFVLIQLAAPLVFLATVLRGFRDRSYWDRLPERFGYTHIRFKQSPIWVHAVSVGEVQAAAPLVRRLYNNATARPILITTTTPTGAARVQALLTQLNAQHAGEIRAQHAFLPYDTPGAVRRFLRRIQPHCVIVMETELWPILLRTCVRQQLPVILASARISPRTAARYAAVKSLFVGSLPQVFVGAQTPADAERLATLGVSSEHLQVTGNIKFDIEIAASVRAAGSEFRSQQIGARPVWIAGSTHEGEESQVLTAHQRILGDKPNALLILAPRHPQRFAAVASLLKSQNFSFVSRSSGGVLQAAHSVLLLDTLGELTTFYAASDVAFVGGSLVPVGGHNLLEPAALSLAVLSGPYTFNAPDVAQRMAEHSAVRHVYSADELAGVVVELLNDPAARARQGAAANAVVQESRGALLKLLSLIQTVCRVEL